MVTKKGLFVLKRRSVLFLLISLFLVVMLAACSGEDGNTNPNAESTPGQQSVSFNEIKACEIVPVEEMSTLADEKIVSSKEENVETLQTKTCNYEPEEVTGTSISVQMLPGSDTAWEAYKTGIGGEEVSGVGDKAVFNKEVGILAVFDDNLIISVSLIDIDTPADQKLETAKKIANVFMERV